MSEKLRQLSLTDDSRGALNTVLWNWLVENDESNILHSYIEQLCRDVNSL